MIFLLLVSCASSSGENIRSSTPVERVSEAPQEKTFYDFIKEGNLDEVSEAINSVNLLEADEDGYLPLSLALANGNDKLIELIFNYTKEYMELDRTKRFFIPQIYKKDPLYLAIINCKSIATQIAKMYSKVEIVNEGGKLDNYFNIVGRSALEEEDKIAIIRYLSGKCSLSLIKNIENKEVKALALKSKFVTLLAEMDLIYLAIRKCNHSQATNTQFIKNSETQKELSKRIDTALEIIDLGISPLTTGEKNGSSNTKMIFFHLMLAMRKKDFDKLQVHINRDNTEEYDQKMKAYLAEIRVFSEEIFNTLEGSYYSAIDGYGSMYEAVDEDEDAYSIYGIDPKLLEKIRAEGNALTLKRKEK